MTEDGINKIDKGDLNKTECFILEMHYIEDLT